MGQGGLAQARWTVEQNMVQRLAPALSRGDGYLEVFLNLVLPDKFGEMAGSEAAVKGYVLSSGLT
jgi:hypothetical protein